MRMQAEVLGEGQPIVLVPGGLTGWLSWKPHAERLSSIRKTVRVQLLSVQFGLEDRPLPPGYSIKTESGALAVTIDSLNFAEPFDLVGWSYGAETSLDYALDHPDRIRSLTLIEPPAFWVLRSKGPLDPSTAETAARLQAYAGEVTEEQLEDFARTVGLLEPGQRGIDLPQWDVWVTHRRSLRNNPAAVNHTDSIARLEAFDSPVLLVKGTGSAPFLHQIIDVLAASLPHAEVVEYPAGHAPHIVSMERFLEKIEQFHSLRHSVR